MASDQEKQRQPHQPPARHGSSDVQTYEHLGKEAFALTWSPDGKDVASGSADATLRLWDATTGQLVRRYEGHASPVWEVEWSPGGRLLASASSDGDVQIWESTEGRLVQHSTSHC